MQESVINAESLRLPSFAMEKIGSRKVIVKEVAEGILLTPIKPVASLRGKYSGVLSTEQFFAQKRADKELEK
jgi:hypothetical protein